MHRRSSRSPRSSSPLWAETTAARQAPCGKYPWGAELVALSTPVAVPCHRLDERLIPPVELPARKGCELEATPPQPASPALVVSRPLQGLQLRADLKVLMGPFSALARRRPEKHFPQLTEAVILLSLEKVGECALGHGARPRGRCTVGWFAPVLPCRRRARVSLFDSGCVSGQGRWVLGGDDVGVVPSRLAPDASCLRCRRPLCSSC